MRRKKKMKSCSCSRVAHCRRCCSSLTRARYTARRFTKSRMQTGREKVYPSTMSLSLDPGERITAAIAVPDFGAHDYCFLATLTGKVKRVDLEEFSSVRPSGMIAMSLESGDELGWAHLTTGNNDIMLITEQGKAVRYSRKSCPLNGTHRQRRTGHSLKRG